MQRKQLGKFDEADIFPDGVFAFPPTSEEPKVKIRALGEYCKQKGVTPDQLSKEEIQQFLVVD
ncbi:hypothetical protein ACJ2A9_19480 [Anaerobacillus sp. MEB173]|uniref:hypothetical protein n=1 Tax=Anaerobacillus sp. MEB173 TaxID=3383345 RepID=UPI003F8E1565